MPNALLPADIKRLQSIQNFDSLVAYLRDDLDWPLDEIDIEDLTFEYSPEELGLQQQYVVKLKSVKQLRPLVTHQPWGIFYLEFEPKKLPVVVLRRILKELVPKKRASANPDERTLWQKQDLLFISSQGEDAHRRLSFAHFRDLPDGRTGLDTFDWDDRETQFAGIGLALDKLHWPPNASDVDAWRKGWASAFTRPHGSVIQNAEQLSRALAELAGRTRAKVEDIYQVERPDGPLHKLFEAFKTALVHDLTPSRFADMVAQTVAYGLFAARAERGDTLHLSHLAEMIPATNPFLRELFGEIEALADDPDSYLSFDELGVSDIVALLNAKNIPAIVEDFGRQTGGGREDPVIHFYESFLKDYDAAQRVQRGVFYTPQPVVSFIVRSVDRILRDEFGLEDGLADTTTWGEMQARHPELTLPAGVSSDAPFVQILDPATGTGTFLVEVIDVIWRTMTAKWEKAGQKSQIHALWNAYVPAHLLPRVNGFELMMASYAIAHVKLGLKLRQTGYEFGSGERLRVFLTNTLEPAGEKRDQQLLMPNFLAHEAQAADRIKDETAFTVLVGNPPYSGRSWNLTEELRQIVYPYRFVDGVLIKEKGALQFEKSIQEDYIKFLRFTQAQVEKTNLGIVGFITSHGFLDNQTLRGMRSSIFHTFNSLNFVDLHGNGSRYETSPDGSVDDNVFDIRKTGAAISILIRDNSGKHDVRQFDLFGSKETVKYPWLRSNILDKTAMRLLAPKSPMYLFVPLDIAVQDEYEVLPRINDFMEVHSKGLVTGRDDFDLDMSEPPLLSRMEDFATSTLPDDELVKKYNLNPTPWWPVEKARKEMPMPAKFSSFVERILYRPFDWRFIFYHPAVVMSPRRPVMQHMDQGYPNLLFITSRMTKGESYRHVLVATGLAEAILLSSKTSNNAICFPLYLYSENRSGTRRPNLTTDFMSLFKEKTGLSVRTVSPALPLLKQKTTPDSSLPPSLGMFTEFHGVFNAELTEEIAEVSAAPENTVTPEDVFHYAYAIFHSPTYRERYAEFLKIDFPRLPLTSDVPLFRALAALGEQLTALHLMERVGPNPAAFPVPGSSSVDAAPKYDKDARRVFINKTQYFAPVPPEVWAFQIGGYQVCHKWLKDRKGRTLTEGDITHYGSIVAALGETIRLMAEIDAVIEEHGGWPLQ